MGNSKSKKKDKDSSVDSHGKLGASGGVSYRAGDSKGSWQSGSISQTAGVSKGSGQSGSISSKAAIGSSANEAILQHGQKLTSAQARLCRDNVDFYKNKIRSKPPPGHSIEDMLKWKGDYGMLERNHSYIQWLFPIPESNGLNMYAQQLFEHEAKAIREDDEARKRVLRAYKMMLDFYGMKLEDSNHGIVTRSDKGWQDRYDHLNRSRHNLLRITRILKSLGELGFERYQARWVEFLIEEAVIKRGLPNLNGQCLMHWVMAVKNDWEREMLYRKANGLEINESNTLYGTQSESEGEDDDENCDIVKTDRPSLPTETDLAKLNLTKKVNEPNDENCSNDKNEPKDDSWGNVRNEPKDANFGNKKYEQLDVEHLKPDARNSISLSKPKMIMSVENETNDVSDFSRSALLDKNTSDYKGTISHSTQMADQRENQSTEYKVHVTASTTEKKSSSAMIQSHENMVTDKEKHPDKRPSDNLRFYQDKILSRPSPGFYMNTMLKWKGDYKLFHEYPGFIHWLFPIPQSVGMNKEAQVLHKHEAKAIREDDLLSTRVNEAFYVILDFYGMKLYNPVAGEFRRNKDTFKDRYEYMQRYPDNYRRITRVLVSIGELGLERFQVPWIQFLIKEGIEKAYFPTLDGASIMHWISAIKDEMEKQAMFGMYQKLAGHKPLVTREDESFRCDVCDTNKQHQTNDRTSEWMLNYPDFV